MMEEEEDNLQEENLNFTSASTTIDSSVISSRIRQSVSLQKEEEQSATNEADEQPHFPQVTAIQANAGRRVEYRRVRCPPHRYTPLREYWEQILTPLVEYLKLQVR